MLSLVQFVVYIGLLLTCVIVVFYAERKVSAFIQDRFGPMEAGKYGVLQAVADLLKMIQKEDILPSKADAILFKTAPFVIFAAVMAGIAIIPVFPDSLVGNSHVGVFLLMAIVSVDIIGMLMAGWGSNSKYALFGALRSVAQIISFEIPLGLSILAVVMTCQSLDLYEIAFQQTSLVTAPQYLFGLKALGIETTQWGGIFAWNILRSPVLLFSYVIFFIATMAECNRAPFDIPEAESELVAGFHVEYSGFRFAIFFLAEYGMMLLVTLLGAILFLGAWTSPLPNIGTLRLSDWTSGTPGTFLGNILGVFWLLSKAVLVMVSHVWIRWTVPRLRVDQLMSLCWKYLTPFGIATMMIAGVWRLLMV